MIVQYLVYLGAFILFLMFFQDVDDDDDHGGGMMVPAYQNN